MNPIDIAVVVIYFVGIMAIGMYGAKRVKDFNSFSTAGRTHLEIGTVEMTGMDQDPAYRVSTPSAAVTFSVCVLFSSPYVTVTR